MDVCFRRLRIDRGGRTVLSIPDLCIRSGAVTAILGPNGAGKSTLLRAIAGLERPTEGLLTVGGSDRGRAGTDQHDVAYSFQNAVFVSGTVERNLHLALGLRGVPKGERIERARAALEDLGAGHLARRDVRRLSGGEAQRVNLARTLMLQSPILLLDEPLAGVDAQSREQLLRDLPLALRRRPGATVALVTHDRDEAARLADDIVLLLDGRVHAAGTVSAVFSHPPDVESARFLGWTTLELDGQVIGIAPGALRVGEGEVRFRLEVDVVVPVGARWEAIGRIGGSPARVSGTGAAPEPGSLTVSTRREDVVALAVS